MTSRPTVHHWDEPAGLAARGTVIVLPGRGEHGGVYERLGRRLAFDAYRVRALADPATAATAVPALLAREETAGPRVLLGSDTGALAAVSLVADGVVAPDALVLAGLPTTAGEPTGSGADFGAELELRTACPTHRGRLTADAAFRRGALTGEHRPPALDRVGVPVLALHGAKDAVSPLSAARRVYSGFPEVHLVSLAGTRHDALNDLTHRTAAASVVLFLERLRLAAGLPPIATAETGLLREVAA
ncbi:alpha/beta hydrolase [Streptomyces xiamenensis]|uniref:alpha/beta hydrolase n=1 Tax=Streptomyces xiamenensis TaxID=408015 RepID=UPI0036EE01F5